MDRNLRLKAFLVTVASFLGTAFFLSNWWDEAVRWKILTIVGAVVSTSSLAILLFTLIAVRRTTEGHYVVKKKSVYGHLFLFFATRRQFSYCRSWWYTNIVLAICCALISAVASSIIHIITNPLFEAERFFFFLKVWTLGAFTVYFLTFCFGMLGEKVGRYPIRFIVGGWVFTISVAFLVFVYRTGADEVAQIGSDFLGVFPFGVLFLVGLVATFVVIIVALCILGGVIAGSSLLVGKGISKAEERGWCPVIRVGSDES